MDLLQQSLCQNCQWAELIASARSRFLRCALSDRDPAFPRYPRLPVLDCAGHLPSRPETEPFAADRR